MVAAHTGSGSGPDSGSGAGIYLDHNATTALRPQARDAMLEAYDAAWANPNSVHAGGRRALGVLERARDTLAELLDAPRGAIVFTSGATEAIDLAFASAIAQGAQRVFVSATEHDAVLAASRQAVDAGLERQEIGVDRSGAIDLAALDAALADGAPTLVAVMAANNETGVLAHLDDVAACVSAHPGTLLLVDAAQAFGKTAFTARAGGADYVTASAHKLGGPPGVGALVAPRGAPITARLVGGGQEGGRRAGTQNVAGAAGFAAAARASVEALDAYGALGLLRDRLETGLRALSPDVRILGEGAARLANTCGFVSPGLSGESALMRLDLAGVMVSAGSACSSGKLRASHVALAMGCSPHDAARSLRVSLGWTSQTSDVDGFLAAWEAMTASGAPSAASSGATGAQSAADTRRTA